MGLIRLSNIEPVVFWLILVISILIALLYRADLAYNTLHFDEAGYLFVGERLLRGETWPTKTYVFSSDYPLMALAYFQKLFGSYGGRVFSSVVSFLSLICLFLLFRTLRCSHKVSLFGVVLVAVQVPHIAVARLATYDALCFFWVILALLLSVCSITFSHKKWLSLLGGGALALAVLAKYIALAYVPAFMFFLLLYARRQALLFSLAACPPLLIYIGIHWGSLIQLFQGQVQGGHAGNVSQWVLVQYMWYLSWPLLIAFILYGVDKLGFVNKGSAEGSELTHKKTSGADLSVLGVSISKEFQILFTALSFSLPLPLYHFYNGDFISLYKHLIYFVTGGSIAWVLVMDGHSKVRFSKRHWKIGFSLKSSLILIFSMANALFWVRQSEQGWPNYSDLYDSVTMKPGVRILSEDPYNFRYRYVSITGLSNIKDVNWFDYDKNGIRDNDDVLQSAMDGYFDYIAIDETIRPNLCKVLKSANYLEKYERVYYSPNQKISPLVNRNGPAHIALYKKIEAKPSMESHL